MKVRTLPLVVFIVALTCCSMLVPPAWSQAPPDVQLTAAAATILYFPFKATFALGGGIVGGLVYVFSGFCETTANDIWIPSMYGTYILTPQHLSLDRPIHLGALKPNSTNLEGGRHATTQAKSDYEASAQEASR